METINNLLNQLKEFLNIHIFSLGEQSVTLWTILYFIILIFLLFFLTGRITKWFVTKVLSKSKIEVGIRMSIGTIIKYIIIVFGLVIILQTVGINLSSLTILAGALGVGIGFGLQNITNNFVSGIIILLERPIKVGDKVEIGEIDGDVTEISMRATTIVTNDNIAMIVPNSQFISSTVINWSYTDKNIRFRIPIGVSYNEDPEKIREILLDIVSNFDGVLKEPAPKVLINSFGDSSINMELRVWTNKYTHRRGFFRSEIYYAIFKRFRKEKIEIPFPQRDLHIKSGSLNEKKIN